MTSRTGRKGPTTRHCPQLFEIQVKVCDYLFSCLFCLFTFRLELAERFVRTGGARWRAAREDYDADTRITLTEGQPVVGHTVVRMRTRV